jgi:hypothetical protein
MIISFFCLNVDYGDVCFSPKKYRRDGKQDRERERERLTTNDHSEPPSKHSSQPPRSRSYYQVIFILLLIASA